MVLWHKNWLNHFVADYQLYKELNKNYFVKSCFL